CCQGCQLRFRCSHVVLQLRKNVDGKRRARDDRFWLDDVQQNDFASELFGKSQRVLKRVFRHVRKINRHENFFETQNLRDHFDGVRGLDALSCCVHLLQFYPQTKTRSAALAESCAFFATAYKQRRSPVRRWGPNKYLDL